jgi:hypothetical protein
VANGYEVRGGEYVLLSQDDIDAAAGEQSHLIVIEELTCEWSPTGTRTDTRRGSSASSIARARGGACSRCASRFGVHDDVGDRGHVLA